ncbi:MAG: tripartite tricarboxylate transporter TctB family protein [Burkholderiales bacterium]|nr:tripartite tricarboxylate transporter TctB family protein [Burkholderiales bacterium]MDP2240192.1 tripartite tricarboxylate transporter TctB family protein [Burkholderiales bacterium]
MEKKNESAGVAAKGISTRAAEIAVALMFFLVGGVVVFDSYRIGSGWSSDGPQAGYFPFYIGLIICISSLVTLGQSLFGAASRSDKVFVEWSQLKQVLSVLVPAALFIGGIQLIGIYIAATIYIAVFMVWLGNYSWLKGIVIGFAVSAVSFATFEIWFQVPLFKGALDPLRFLGY